MATKAMLDRLVRLKVRAKQIEEQAKEVQEAIFASEDYPNEHMVQNLGMIRLSRRQNYSIPTNAGLIKEVGQTTFNERAKMSPSEVKKAVGEKGFEVLLEKGVVLEGKLSEYYTVTVLAKS